MVDTGGSKVKSPRYLGTEIFWESMMFETTEFYSVELGGSVSTSMYDLMSTGLGAPLSIWQNNPVTQIQEQLGGKWTIESEKFTETNYDHVIITIPSWNFGTETSLVTVNRETAASKWPTSLQTFLKRAHWEPACKVFVSLKEPFWENAALSMPQMFATDTYIRDAYGIKLDVDTNQKGAMLVSYSWWRDANKLVSYSDSDLINLCVRQLDEICQRCINVNGLFSDYVDYSQSYVVHWEMERFTKGAARLYDQREWNDTQVPMMYNQVYSTTSKLYLAGESYHVDAGWTEPCMRMAIDSVLRILDNDQDSSITVPNFVFSQDYTQYNESFVPV